MSDSKKNYANKLIELIKEVFEENEWKYKFDEEDNTISFTFCGDDLDMDYIFSINADMEHILLYSILPVKIDASKIAEWAIAVNHANNGLNRGTFEINAERETISYRMSQIYCDSIISKQVIYDMVHLSNLIVDHYNDKFFMLANGMINLKDFLEKVK